MHPLSAWARLRDWALTVVSACAFTFGVIVLLARSQADNLVDSYLREVGLINGLVLGWGLIGFSTALGIVVALWRGPSARTDDPLAKRTASDV